MLKIANPPENRDDGSANQYRGVTYLLCSTTTRGYQRVLPLSSRLSAFWRFNARPEGDKSAAQRDQTYSSREQ
ncbi:hypothetical protein KCP78_17950 [Salmonella enterica subsp. enterica]|nr:hypothetical protein KCP78_17950 [Salmonella enterica subsp. enterica]